MFFTEKRGSTAFRLYTCPLGDKRCDKRGIRWPYAPYWFKHTFIEIEGMCYDWGNWNYPVGFYIHKERECVLDWGGGGQ